MKALIYFILTIALPFYFVIYLIYLAVQLFHLDYQASKVFDAYEPVVYLHSIEKRKQEAINAFKRFFKFYYKKV